MAQEKVRVVKPPIDDVTSGRVFQPTNAFLFKKMVKAIVVMGLIWLALYALFMGFTNPVFLDLILALSQPLEILVMIGWETFNQYYILCAITVFIIGSVYSYIYVRKIEYSVVGWSGDVMPEIYTRKGIINITKIHVPFRTIVNVRTTKGIVDRLFGIGSVLIETAGGSIGAQPTGLVSLLFARFSSSAAEEKIEGIRFHEELRDFILREMRHFGRKRSTKDTIQRRKRIFTRDTLEAFREIRDALKESMQESR
ncbi:hypothetical protein EU527_05440 [Candidatus Thorarchaeota archaeon]|nr:MAG: hypothetical protein EU527_05440 [Candidatus Thorarchaeota archaeon]